MARDQTRQPWLPTSLDEQFHQDCERGASTRRPMFAGGACSGKGAVLMQSDMVAVLGHQIALEFRRAYAIELKKLPFESPVLRSVMHCHKSLPRSAGPPLLRETIMSVPAHL
jgi:hypothetical protein